MSENSRRASMTLLLIAQIIDLCENVLFTSIRAASK